MVEGECYYVPSSRLALVYLAIPATSAPSERVFRRAGRILTMKRASLSPDIAQRMMFIKENANLLHKHYDTVARLRKDRSKDHLIEDERSFLPKSADKKRNDVPEVEVIDVDAGEHGQIVNDSRDMASEDEQDDTWYDDCDL